MDNEPENGGASAIQEPEVGEFEISSLFENTETVSTEVEEEPDSSDEDQISDEFTDTEEINEPGVEEEGDTETEEEDELSEDVLSQRGAKHAKRTIDKLTRKLRETEEKFNDRIADLESKLSEPESSDIGVEERVFKAQTIDDLDSISDKAEEAFEFAEDALDSGEYGDYTEEQLKQIKATSRKTSRLIRSRKKEIAKLDNEKSQWANKAVQDFPVLSDQGSEEFKQVATWMKNPEFKKVFSSSPQAIYFAALASIGLKHHKQTLNGKENPKKVPAKKKATQRAPRVPGGNGSGMAAPSSRFEQTSDKKQSLPEGNLDDGDISNFFLDLDKQNKK